MSGIRPFTAADVEAVASLYEREMRSGSGTPAPGLREYLTQVFLDEEGLAGGLRSLVYAQDGEVRAFLGIQGRRFLLDGRPVVLGYCGPLVTAPGSHALAAFLMKAFLDGPQEISLTDGATSSAVRLWTRARGAPHHLTMVRWTRLFRPWAFTSNYLSRRPRLGRLWRPIEWLGRPLAALADRATRALTGGLFRSAPATLRAEPLTPAGMRLGLAALSRQYRLRRDYDEAFLAHLFDEMRRLEERGTLRAHLLRNDAGDIAGWYVYYHNRGGISRVVEIAARPQTVRDVILHLFADADAGGATALQGRLEPALAEPLSHLRTSLQYAPSAALVHSRDPEFFGILCRGEALLTRLDGEWWLGFQLAQLPSPDSRGPRSAPLPAGA